MLASEAARASNSLTAVVVDKVDSNKVVKVAAERLNLALGVGLGQLRGRVFRIGHLGSLNELADPLLPELELEALISRSREHTTELERFRAEAASAAFGAH